MTYETLERANELSEQMNNLLDIQNMMNTNDECGHNEYDFIEITRKNYSDIPVSIPAEICEKIVELIAEERRKLRAEFDKL